MPKYQLQATEKMSVAEKLEINSLLIHLITASKGDLSKINMDPERRQELLAKYDSCAKSIADKATDNQETTNQVESIAA